MKPTHMKLPLGSPAWLRAQADEKEEMAHAMPSPMFGKEDKREIAGLRDAAAKIEKLESALRDLNHRVHSGYDFNADPDRMTLRVSEALA